jgi:Uma2 family endonuclease
MATGYSDSIVPAMPITIYSPDERPAIVVPPTARTWKGYREWALSDDFPERGNICFVNGEILIDMSPERIDTHNFVKLKVSAVLALLVGSIKTGYVFADRTLLSNQAAGVSTEPDAMFVSRDSLSKGLVQFVPGGINPLGAQEVVGQPDWVLEVLSPSSRKKDKILLRKGYYEAGIPEYWLIDALNNEIDFQMLIRGEKDYEPVMAQDGWLASATFGKSFKLERILHEDGFLEYTLHMK